MGSWPGPCTCGTPRVARPAAEPGLRLPLPDGAVLLARPRRWACPAWVVQRLWWALLLVRRVPRRRHAARGRSGSARRRPALIGRPRVRPGAAHAHRPSGRSRSRPGRRRCAPWVLVPLVLGAAARSSPRRAAALSGAGGAASAGSTPPRPAAVLPLGVLWLLTRRRVARRRLCCLWWPSLVVLGHRCGGWCRCSCSAATARRSSTSSRPPRSPRPHHHARRALRGTADWVPYLEDLQRRQRPADHPLLVVNDRAAGRSGLGGLAWRRTRPRVWCSCLLCGLSLVTLGHVGPVDGLARRRVRAALDGALAPLRNVHKFDILSSGCRWPSAWRTSSRALARRHRVLDDPLSLRPVRRGRRGLRRVGAAAPCCRRCGCHATGPLRPASRTTGPRRAAGWTAPGPRPALLVPGSRFAALPVGHTGDEPIQSIGAVALGGPQRGPAHPAGHIRLLDAWSSSRRGTGVGLCAVRWPAPASATSWSATTSTTRRPAVAARRGACGPVDGSRRDGRGVLRAARPAAAARPTGSSTAGSAWACRRSRSTRSAAPRRPPCAWPRRRRGGRGRRRRGSRAARSRGPCDARSWPPVAAPNRPRRVPGAHRRPAPARGQLRPRHARHLETLTPDDPLRISKPPETTAGRRPGHRGRRAAGGGDVGDGVVGVRRRRIRGRRPRGRCRTRPSTERPLRVASGPATTPQGSWLRGRPRARRPGRWHGAPRRGHRHHRGRRHHRRRVERAAGRRRRGHPARRHHREAAGHCDLVRGDAQSSGRPASARSRSRPHRGPHHRAAEQPVGRRAGPRRAVRRRRRASCVFLGTRPLCAPTAARTGEDAGGLDRTLTLPNDLTGTVAMTAPARSRAAADPAPSRSARPRRARDGAGETARSRRGASAVDGDLGTVGRGVVRPRPLDHPVAGTRRAR